MIGATVRYKMADTEPVIIDEYVENTKQPALMATMEFDRNFMFDLNSQLNNVSLRIISTHPNYS